MDSILDPQLDEEVEGPAAALTAPAVEPETDLGSQLDAFIAENESQVTDLNAFQVKNNIQSAGAVNADQHAIDVNRADKNELPVGVAQGQREAFDGADLDREVEKLNPGYLQWLANSDNATIAQDDKPVLDQIANLWDATKTSYQTGNAIVDVGVLGMKNIQGTLTEGEKLTLAAREADMARLQQQQRLSGFGTDSAIEQALMPSGFLLSSTESLPMMLHTQYNSLDELLGGTLLGGAYGFASTFYAGGLGTIPGAIGGAGAGWRVGVGMSAGKLEAGLAFQEYLKLKDENGDLLDRDTARIAALLTGAVNGSLEVFAAKAAINAFPGGEAFLRRIGRDGMRQALRQPQFRNVLTNYAKRVGRGMYVEGVTEFLQETMTKLAGSFAKAFQQGKMGELMEGDFWAKTLGESAYAGVRGAQGGGGTNTVLAVPTAVWDAHKIRNAKQTKAFFDELAAGATESKTRQRSPGRFGEFIRGQAEGSQADTVHMNANRFFEMFQNLGFEQDEVVDEFGFDDAEVSAARESNTEISMDIGTFASKIAPNEQLYKGVEADIKLNLDAMTVREAVKYEETIQADVESAVEQLTQQYEGAEDTEIINSEIFSQLRQAGLGQSVAEYATQNYVAAIVAAAEMDGVTPLEMYARYPLDFERALPRQLEIQKEASAQQRQIFERARTGERRSSRQLFGDNLVEFVRQFGIRYDPDNANLTADPMIGDLLGMDIDRSLKPGERKALRPEGIDLDELTLKAQEAGYFPNQPLEQRVDINQMLEAIRDNLSGAFTYVPGQENTLERNLDEAADELVEALNSIDLDPSDMTLEEIERVVDRERSREIGDGGMELRHSAYHGTGAENLEGGRFRLDRVGDRSVGEGYTAFGWGLYFASERGVAEHYQRQNSRGVLVNGKALSEVFETKEGRNAAMDVLVHTELYFDENWSSVLNFQKAVEEALRAHAPLTGKEDVFYGDRETFGTEELANAHKRDMQRIKDLKDGDLKRSEGSLFRVNLQPDVDDYFDFDLRMHEQTPEIQERIRRLLNPSEGVYFDFYPPSDGLKWRSWSVMSQIGLTKPAAGPFSSNTSGQYVDVTQESSDDIWTRLKRVYRSPRQRDADKREREQLIETRRRRYQERIDMLFNEGIEGETLYRVLSEATGSDQAVSMLLRDAGIPGNRFLSNQARQAQPPPFGRGRELLFRGAPLDSGAIERSIQFRQPEYTGEQGDQPITSVSPELIDAMREEQLAEIKMFESDIEQIEALKPEPEGPAAAELNSLKLRMKDARRELDILETIQGDFDQLKIEKTGAGFNYVIYDDSLIDIEGKQGIDFYQSSVPLQRRPLKLTGTGPHGRITNWDFGQALTDRHMEKHGRVLDPDNEDDFKLIVREASREFINQARETDTGEAWYTDDVATAIETTAQYIPQLDNAHPDAADNQELFLVMAALLSPQERPPQNWEKASLAFEGFARDGRIPEKKPNGAGWGVNQKALPLLQHMLDTMGVEKTLAFLRDPHTGKELAELRRDSGLYKDGDKTQPIAKYLASETNQTEAYLGIYMFGPKVGDFMMNSTGIDLEAVTVDLWLARTYNRHIGRLLDVPPGDAAQKKIISEIRGVSERKLIKKFVAELAKHHGLTNSAMQAALWYYEQRLFRNHGIQAASTNFSGAAKIAAEARGVTFERTGAYVRGSEQVADGEQPSETPGSFEAYQSPRRLAKAYSGLDRAARELKTQKGTGEQFLGELRKRPGVKEEEITSIGLDDYLEGKTGVTRDQVLNYIEENQIEIREVVRDAPTENRSAEEWQQLIDDAERVRNFDEAERLTALWERSEGVGTDEGGMLAPKFASIVIPGGKNYREIVFHLPSNQVERYAILSDGIFVASAAETYEEALEQANNIPQHVRVLKTHNQEAGRDFQGGHFPEPNILAHVRLNDRVGPNGERILFIEEIQSDWHQQGRERGYDKPLSERIAQAQKELADAEAQAAAARDGVIDAVREVQGDNTEIVWNTISTLSMPQLTRYAKHAGMKAEPVEKYSIALNNMHQAKIALEETERGIVSMDTVPDGPLKGGWAEFAFRQVAQLAVSEGYDEVAWTPGSVQNQRYDLSESVDAIEVSNLGDGRYNVDAKRRGNDKFERIQAGIEESKLSSVIGKAQADRAIEMMKEKGGSGLVTLEGNDLKLGAEGMEGFYDKRIRNYASNWGKKLKTNVKTTTIGANQSQQSDYAIEEHEGVFYITMAAADIGPIAINGNQSAAVLDEKYDHKNRAHFEAGFSSREDAEAQLNVTYNFEALEGMNAAQLMDLLNAPSSEGKTIAEDVEDFVVDNYIDIPRPRGQSFGSQFMREDTAREFLEIAIRHGYDIRQDIQDVWSLPISDKMRERIEENSVPIYNRVGDGPRGSFRKGDNFGEGGRSTIRMFRNADPSTVLHELSHYYLEMMRDRAKRPMAAEQLKRDWETLEDWWEKNPELIAEKAMKEAEGRGIKIKISAEQAKVYSVTGTTGDQAVYTASDGKTFDLDMIMFIAQHEVTADAHEVYLMEGKSPSIKLTEAFERFSAWMTRVYSAVTNLGVTPPPEIKQVFDRWLATEAEIKQAEQFSSAARLFETFEEFDGTLEEYEEYRGAETRQHAKAKEQLMRRKMRDVERQATEEGQALKDEVYAQVANEINQMPVYRLWEFLARGRVLAGEQPAEFLEAGKRLSKNWLVANFGEDITRILPKGGNRIHQRDTPGNEGLNPEVVAEAFGFQSVDAMIDAIVGAPNRKQYVAQEQQKRLQDDPRWQGDTVQSGNIEEAALDTIHNDERATFLALELQAINRKGGKKQPSARQIAKATATRILGRIKVQSAVTPGKYRTAEARFAREAQEAVAAGDFDAASAAKYQQLLNHYLYSEALKVREEVEKGVKYVRKFTGVRKKLQAIDHEYVERIQEVLEGFQFTPRLTEARRERLNAAALEAWAEKKNKDEGAELLIPQEVLDADERTHYRDIPVSEFRALLDTIKNMEAQGRLATKIKLAGEQLELDEFAGEASDSIYENWHGGFKNLNEPRTETQQKVSAQKRIWSLRKMEFVMRRLDGFKTGPMSKVFRMIADADDVFNERRADFAKRFREIWGVYGALELRRMANKKIAIPEINMSLTKDAILAVAFNSGNEDNRIKMMEGYGWSDAQVDAILRLLDPRDWKVVQDVFDHLESYWAETVALDIERRGYPASKVEASPIILDGVEMAKGGYYPLKWNYLADGKKRDDIPMAYDMLKMGNQSMSSHPSTHTGRTIERQTSAGGRKVLLQGMNVYIRAADETIHDLSWRSTVKDVTKIMNHKDIREALQTTMGEEFIEQFNDWFSDSVVGDQNDPRTADAAFRFLRGRTSVATMGWKISTALVQPLGYFSTISRLIQDYGIANGGMYALKGLKDFYGGNPVDMNKRIQFVFERSAMMRQRSATFDRDVFDNLKRLRSGKYGEVEASFFYMTSKLQLAVDMPTWMAAFNAAQANDPSMTEEQAAREADSVVRMTQSSGAAKDLSNFQRGGEGKKLFGFYMTFFSAMTNMIEDQFIFAKQNRKYIPRTIASLFVLTFMPVVFEEYIKEMLGVGYDEETEDDEWGEYLVKKWAAFSLGGIPVVRDLMNSALTEFDYTFSPAARIPEMLIKGGTQLKEVIYNVDDGITFDSAEIDRDLAKAAVDVAAIALPLPSSQLKLTGEYFLDWWEGTMEPDNWANFMAEAFYRKDPKEF